MDIFRNFSLKLKTPTSLANSFRSRRQTDSTVSSVSQHPQSPACPLCEKLSANIVLSESVSAGGSEIVGLGSSELWEEWAHYTSVSDQEAGRRRVGLRGFTRVFNIWWKARNFAEEPVEVNLDSIFAERSTNTRLSSVPDASPHLATLRSLLGQDSSTPSPTSSSPRASVTAISPYSTSSTMFPSGGVSLEGGPPTSVTIEILLELINLCETMPPSEMRPGVSLGDHYGHTTGDSDPQLPPGLLDDLVLFSQSVEILARYKLARSVMWFHGGSEVLVNLIQRVGTLLERECRRTRTTKDSAQSVSTGSQKELESILCSTVSALYRLADPTAVFVDALSTLYPVDASGLQLFSLESNNDSVDHKSVLDDPARVNLTRGLLTVLGARISGLPHCIKVPTPRQKTLQSLCLVMLGYLAVTNRQSTEIFEERTTIATLKLIVASHANAESNPGLCPLAFRVCVLAIRLVVILCRIYPQAAEHWNQLKGWKDVSELLRSISWFHQSEASVSQLVPSSALFAWKETFYGELSIKTSSFIVREESFPTTPRRMTSDETGTAISATIYPPFGESGAEALGREPVEGGLPKELTIEKIENMFSERNLRFPAHLEPSLPFHIPEVFRSQELDLLLSVLAMAACPSCPPPRGKKVGQTSNFTTSTSASSTFGTWIDVEWIVHVIVGTLQEARKSQLPGITIYLLTLAHGMLSDFTTSAPSVTVAFRQKVLDSFIKLELWEEIWAVYETTLQTNRGDGGMADGYSPSHLDGLRAGSVPISPSAIVREPGTFDQSGSPASLQEDELPEIAEMNFTDILEWSHPQQTSQSSPHDQTRWPFFAIRAPLMNLNPVLRSTCLALFERSATLPRLPNASEVGKILVLMRKLDGKRPMEVVQITGTLKRVFQTKPYSTQVWFPVSFIGSPCDAR
ncbi:hypothetical protein HDU93_003610 [Gonapodya sp. JEL0774]|nr:hypothetical protein HDU93_003610 [Gonapodya sp. JEL0774]